MKITALAGGVGGAKLLMGLQRVLGPEELTAVVNTGDDADIYGVHVSPDVDIVTYWLAGIADFERGWGIVEDTFEVIGALETLGAESWFGLGDRDFATCLHRTGRLRAGATLTAVTDEIRRHLDVPTRILPMSDEEVRTKVVTDDGRTLEFQEYFVRERTEPEVVEVRFAGIADAKPSPGVIEAIDEADRVVVCPSNPIVSIGPIVSLPGVRDALRSHPLVIAITPIVRGAALKGPADRLLRSLGYEPSASAVARLYADFADVYVVDSSDEPEVEPVEGLGISVAMLDTVMADHDASERLARALLDL
ncbi:MAG: 2-phospho-L-lactate transferase [Actinomycetota bacterium]